MSLDEIELEDLCTGRFCEVPKGSDMCMQDVVLGLTLADLQGFTKDEFVSVVRDEHGPWKQCGAWLIAKHENLPYGKTMLEEFLRVSAPVAQATSSWQTAEPDRNRSRRSPSPSRRVPSPVSAEIPGPRKTSPTLSSPRRPSSVAPLEVPVKSSSSPKFSPRRALSPGRGKAATGGNKGTISNLLFKTVVVGGGAVGKSALTIMYMQKHFVEEYDPTVEDSYRRGVTLEIDSVERNVVLDLLDTAGQEEYSAMREQYMQQGDGFIIVFSLTNRDSFDECDVFHEQMLQVRELLPGGAGSDSWAPCVLVGNKSDLDEFRQVPTEEAAAKAKRWGVPYFETSALSGRNVDLVYTTIIREMWRDRLANCSSSNSFDSSSSRRCTIL